MKDLKLLVYQAVVHCLPLIFVIYECFADVLELRKFVQSADFIPGLTREPGGGIAVWIVESNASSQKEPPLLFVNVAAMFEDVDAQQERE